MAKHRDGQRFCLTSNSNCLLVEEVACTIPWVCGAFETSHTRIQNQLDLHTPLPLTGKLHTPVGWRAEVLIELIKITRGANVCELSHGPSNGILRVGYGAA